MQVSFKKLTQATSQALNVFINGRPASPPPNLRKKSSARQDKERTTTKDPQLGPPKKDKRRQKREENDNVGALQAAREVPGRPTDSLQDFAEGLESLAGLPFDEAVPAALAATRHLLDIIAHNEAHYSRVLKQHLACGAPSDVDEASGVAPGRGSLQPQRSTHLKAPDSQGLVSGPEEASVPPPAQILGPDAEVVLAALAFQKEQVCEVVRTYLGKLQLTHQAQLAKLVQGNNEAMRHACASLASKASDLIAQRTACARNKARAEDAAACLQKQIDQVCMPLEAERRLLQDRVQTAKDEVECARQVLAAREAALALAETDLEAAEVGRAQALEPLLIMKQHALAEHAEAEMLAFRLEMDKKQLDAEEAGLQRLQARHAEAVHSMTQQAQRVASNEQQLQMVQQAAGAAARRRTAAVLERLAASSTIRSAKQLQARPSPRPDHADSDSEASSSEETAVAAVVTSRNSRSRSSKDDVDESNSSVSDGDQDQDGSLLNEHNLLLHKLKYLVAARQLAAAQERPNAGANASSLRHAASTRVTSQVLVGAEVGAAEPLPAQPPETLVPLQVIRELCVRCGVRLRKADLRPGWVWAHMLMLPFDAASCPRGEALGDSSLLHALSWHSTASSGRSGMARQGSSRAAELTHGMHDSFKALRVRTGVNE